MDAPLALYRRYRPETFAEVIGQDHVTGPLRAALANNRVHHAYLFSGPRGCGKTTSARILARALNCEQGPTPEPCGQCRSCQDLARGGPGSIDVIEIDAASHGGVDDARDLRERAFFAPVNSRYKVYIIDEAHMVSPQGFNALLKLVEEPPPHLKFIFATTEPEKVIGTIRSRTHHYPFRLIPPRTLSAYLAELCEREGVRIEPAALPLVVRAGGGSARDTLSVLDQLIGGAGPDGVTHQLATGLLGYTPDTLLDEVIDAFAAGDGGTVFGVVDKVIETGQDPRRFTEDLLRRLRDLVIIAAVPDASASGLIDVAEDQGERLVAQAARFGRADLSRAADLVAAGLTEMRGATAPRLLLELICARVLLPGSDDSTHGVLARLDRIEKRIAIEGGAPSQAQHVGRPAPPRPSAPSAAPPSSPSQEPSPTPSRAPSESPSESPSPAPAPPPAGTDHSGWPTPAQPGGPSEPHQPTPGQEPAQPHRPADAAPAAAAPPVEERQEAGATTPGGDAPGSSGLSLVEVRRLWPDLLESVKLKRRFTWIMLSQNAQVAAVDDKTLTVALLNAGARDSFLRSGSDEILRQAAIDVIGRDWRVDAIVDPSAQPGADHDPAPTVTRPAVRPADGAPPRSAGQGGGPQDAPAGSGEASPSASVSASPND
ncbi:MAG TPA: DNA polymerase III subunit gamma and tau, partial [Nocardioidaceae bacterium]|nr:DNA polymerase III subunit gamma and tau [Nocardioidaceae bacterium]